MLELLKRIVSERAVMFSQSSVFLNGILTFDQEKRQRDLLEGGET